MKIILLLLIIFEAYSCKDEIEAYKLSEVKISQKIGFQKSKNNEKDFYLYNTIQYNVEKKNNFYFMNGLNIPSDLIGHLSSDKKEKSFEILINQGSLSSGYKADSFNKINTNQENFFYNDDVLVDYPSGYLYHSTNFSPDEISKFKNFFDLFSTIYKITLNPILDRSSFIKDEEKGMLNIYLIENKERACTDHLDSIKETLPVNKWSRFMKNINYKKFSESDFKTIKYFLKYSPIDEKIYFNYKIIYRIESKDVHKEYQDLELFDLLKTDDQSKIKSRSLFKSSRYFQGEMFNFENFKYTNEFSLEIFDYNQKYDNNKKFHLKIIDLIPNQLDILLSTIKIELNVNGILFAFDFNNLNHILNLEFIESVEHQHPAVPFTYESKKMKKIHFRLKDSFIKDYLMQMKNRNVRFDFKISYELRKKLLNFESYENNLEYGCTYPCGLIIYDDIPYITNHIYFNFPNVDDTMPFNIIAFSWVVYGFILIQILNLFLTGGKGEKSLFQTIKDRFMAKWGFLFGR
jgi:hypothetical protein